MSCTEELAIAANEFVECFLAIPAGVEKASDYAHYNFVHGSLTVPLNWIRGVRKHMAKVRKSFEQLESYCLAHGCYSVANEDRCEIKAAQLRLFTKRALKCLSRCAQQLQLCITGLARCARRCRTQASLFGSWSRDAGLRDARDNECEEQADYCSKILESLALTGEMVQEVAGVLPSLIRRVGEQEAELLTSVDNVIGKLASLFQ